MQIVINIDDNTYEAIKHEYCVSLPQKGLLKVLWDAIQNSTPLPKGHGRLIDANELKKIYDERITYLYALNKKDNPSRETRICTTNWCTNTIDELPTIIKAESEE